MLRHKPRLATLRSSQAMSESLPQSDAPQPRLTRYELGRPESRDPEEIQRFARQAIETLKEAAETEQRQASKQGTK